MPLSSSSERAGRISNDARAASAELNRGGGLLRGGALALARVRGGCAPATKIRSSALAGVRSARGFAAKAPPSARRSLGELPVEAASTYGRRRPGVRRAFARLRGRTPTQRRPEALTALAGRSSPPANPTARTSTGDMRAGHDELNTHTTVPHEIGRRLDARARVALVHENVPSRIRHWGESPEGLPRVPPIDPQSQHASRRDEALRSAIGRVAAAFGGAPIGARAGRVAPSLAASLAWRRRARSFHASSERKASAQARRVCAVETSAEHVDPAAGARRWNARV